MAEIHSIFDDIWRGDLAAVQQHVMAGGPVLEERESNLQGTPIMCAIDWCQPAIALWLIRHRRQHDIETADDDGWTALHWASYDGPLEVVQALVVAGANSLALTERRSTPLIWAGYSGHTDIVALLLQLPSVKATIDAIDQDQDTAISFASSNGHQPIVQLLLDAGADPTIPAGPHSPIHQALSNNHHTVTALLRHAIAEPERVHALHKARSLLGAGAAALPCLRGRGEQGLALPRVDVITLERHHQQQQELQQQLQQWNQLQQQQQQLQRQQQQLQRQQQQLHAQLRQLLQELQKPQLLPLLPQLQQSQHELQLLLQRRQGETHAQPRVTAKFAGGVSGGEKDSGLCEELYLELLGYMLPAWADKGPEA